jgi:hypothetical protein
MPIANVELEFVSATQFSFWNAVCVAIPGVGLGMGRKPIEVA